MRDKILNFDNGITEIPTERETNCGNVITEIGKKKFVAMPKMEGKKKIVVAKITCEELKKKMCYVYNIFTTNHR